VFYWDRGRPARTERSEQPVELNIMRDHSHLTVLVAGGTPAIPVKTVEVARE